jgi:hypothetical protein
MVRSGGFSKWSRVACERVGKKWEKGFDAESRKPKEIPDVGDSCYRPSEDSPDSRPEKNLFVAFETGAVHAQDDQSPIDLMRPPVRDIRDTAPIFSSVGVDAVRNEVYLQDSNRWSIRVFSRLDDAKPGAPVTEPRRIISDRCRRRFRRR